jgi:hypothetical protein
MKGSLLDFLEFAGTNPELTKDIIELAAKYDFEFTEELSDDELDGVSGGTVLLTAMGTFTSAIDAYNAGQKSLLGDLADMNEQAEALGDYLKDEFGVDGSGWTQDTTKG